MKKNIDKLLDRDAALNNLMTRAEDLETSSTTYNQTTQQLRRKYWWKNAKVQKIQFFIIIHSFFLGKFMHCCHHCRSDTYHYK
jgi:hypothetical protein